MSVATSEPLVESVLAGGNPKLRRLAAEGILPVEPGALVALQVQLLGDGEVGDLARQSVLETPVPVLLEYVRGEPVSAGLECLSEHSNTLVVEAVLQSRAATGELVMRLAPSVGHDLQEIVLLRQDLIVECPEILDSLATNPDLSAYADRRIAEYRQHLLGSDDEPEADELDDDALEELYETGADEPEVQAAIEEVREEIEPEGEIVEAIGLSEGQIRQLATPLRVKLARGASRSLRGILLRDTNPQVAVAVLTASAVTESEIEQVSGNRNVVEEVLTAISRRREWVGKYTIMLNLVKNPRTPVAIAVKLLPRLSVRELGLLRRDRNVADAVRQMALRMFLTKSR